MKKEYYLIDIVKLFFAFCIVGIHTDLLSVFPEKVSFWIMQLIFRLGVPFFFVVSGAFLGCKLEKNNYDYEMSKNAILAYCKRLAVLLVVFEPISVIISVFVKMRSGMACSNVILKVFEEILFYPKGALWFLQACIVGSLLFLLFLRKKRLKSALFVSLLLYLCALPLNSYSFTLNGFPFLGKFADFYFDYFISARNGLFVGFFFIVLGVICNHIKNRFTTKKIMSFCVVSFFLYFVELFCLRSLGAYPSRDDFSLFISLPFFIFFFVLLLLRFHRIPSGKNYCRNLSTGIYLLHSPLKMVVGLSSLSVLKIKLENGILFIVVSAVAITICMWAYKTDNPIAKFLK